MTSAKSTLRGAATLFVVQDVLKSVAHYRDVLGFTVEFTYGEPTFDDMKNSLRSPAVAFRVVQNPLRHTIRL